MIEKKSGSKMNMMKKMILMAVQLTVFLLSLACTLNYPNEEKCKDSILSMQNGSYELWILNQKESLSFFDGKQKKLSTGSKTKGYYFDEDRQLQYFDGSAIILSEEEIERYKNLSEDYLERIIAIIENNEYNAYSDQRPEYRKTLYYFEITDKGLEIFDETFKSGRITFVFRKGSFAYFELKLVYEGEKEETLELGYGQFDFYPINL